ncbi:MAG TPA: thioredoxin [Clostridia bacterium]|jgi:thioredoxin 1|nr:thioredoxin [Clostridia bacterium]
MTAQNVVTITDNNFTEEVINSDQPVLVDFWAAWCGPCQMLGPVVDQIAEELSGKIKVGKLNVDENRATASQYGIMSIPTLLMFKDGKVVEKIVGALPKQVLMSKIEAYI